MTELPMTDVRAVIFDLGRVLIDLDLTAGLFGRLLDRSAADPDTFIHQLLADPLFQDFCRGGVPVEAFRRQVLARTGLELDQAAFEALWCAVFLPMPGMEALVRRLAERMPLGLLSDTDPLHWPHLLALQPWLALFKRPTLSFETGLLKPDPACYRLAAESVDQPPAACLFIDDLEVNVAGARRAGMQALRFGGVEDLSAHLMAMQVLAPRA